MYIIVQRRKIEVHFISIWCANKQKAISTLYLERCRLMAQHWAPRPGRATATKLAAIPPTPSHTKWHYYEPQNTGLYNNMLWTAMEMDVCYIWFTRSNLAKMREIRERLDILLNPSYCFACVVRRYGMCVMGKLAGKRTHRRIFHNNIKFKFCKSC